MIALSISVKGGGGGKGAIIRGTAIIRGNTVSCYLLSSKLFRDNLPHLVGDFARLLTVQFTSNEGMSNEAPLPKGWRGGGCSGFRMGAKTKTPINPRGKNVFIHQNL